MTPLAWLLARRRFGALALSGSVLLGLASAAACSFIVGDSLPHFTCSTDPNAVDVCPSGQWCSAVEGQPGICVSVNDATPDATVAQDANATDAAGASSDDTADAGSVDAGANEAGDARVDGPAWVATPDAGIDAGPCSAGEIGCPCVVGAPSVAGTCETSTFCLDRQIVAAAYPADAGASTGVCSKACCTSSDCDKGTVCYATGAGGNYCLPVSTLSDRSTAGPLNGAGGQACDAGASCRSGLCALGYCADTCCSTAAPVPPRMPIANPAAQCATGASCQFGTFPVEPNSADVPHCAPAISGGNNGTPCNSNSGCKSNLCANDNQQPLTCRDPCRRPEDCSGSGNMREQACEYVQLPVTGSDGGVVAACVPLTVSGPPPADGGVADWGECKTTSDCARGYCAQSVAGMVCVSVCFSDGDCVVAGECRPQTLVVGASTYSVLACK
ncbi:MAG: hypothetical protein WBY94_13545 [Polyangiaceae bacterium]